MLLRGRRWAGQDLQRAPSEPDLQRAPSHPLPEIQNVMISADDFIRILGRLEADLERIHSTPLEQRDLVREALDTLMRTAAAFARSGLSQTRQPL